jgi:hypothetical protein
MNDTVSEDVKLTGGEIWEFLYSDMHGGVPEALTDDVLERLALHIRTHFIAANKPPLADVTVEEIERIVLETEPDVPSSVDGSKIWTRRMAKALHARLYASPPMPGRGEGSDAEALRVAREVISDMVRYGLISNEVGTTAYYVGDNVLPIIMGRPLAASRPKEDTHAK